MIYLTADGGYAETEIKRSQFIACVKKAGDEKAARDFIDEVKKKHAQARHNCYAYIVYDEGQERVRYSDDGEPQGTAGLPILNVLKNRGLSHVVAVVTRYFGGIKLGAGGLTRAYTDACAKAADSAELFEIVLCAAFEIDFSYENYKKFSAFRLPAYTFVYPPEFGSGVKIKLVTQAENADEFLDSFNGFFLKRQPISRLNDVLHEFKKD